VVQPLEALASEKRLFSAVCGGQVGQRPTLLAALVARSPKGLRIPIYLAPASCAVPWPDSPTSTPRRRDRLDGPDAVNNVSNLPAVPAVDELRYLGEVQSDDAPSADRSALARSPGS
jgi:hypothetical protein